MIKSLRLRIQLWHAVILMIVVTVFGFAFHRQLHRATMDEIDTELLSGARVLEGTLRTLTPDELQATLGMMPLSLPREFSRRPGPPPRDDGELPMAPPRRPQETTSYFAIFAADGVLLRGSAEHIDVQWQAPREPMEYRNVDGRRELLLRGPLQTLIVVGRDVQPKMARLTAALLQIVLVGASVLTLGLVGGWWLAGKAIDPIKRISQTATSISASNLSERIATSTMDDELRSLATVLNSMLSRLQGAFEQQSQFTADASHELRTPISVLLSHCELALSRPRSTEEYRYTIETCQKAAHRMRSLVESLLTLARADAGKLELDKSEIDLHGLAVEARAMFTPLADEHQVQLTVAGTAAVCAADSSRVSQLIANLVSNAITYNHPGGQVLIETSVENEFAVLSVRDTGVGIPSLSIPHLFDRFYRVDESRSRPTGGSGLGLAICKSITDAHHGTLTVESQLGESSLFVVQLPIR